MVLAQCPHSKQVQTGGWSAPGHNHHQTPSDVQGPSSFIFHPKLWGFRCLLEEEVAQSKNNMLLLQIMPCQALHQEHTELFFFFFQLPSTVLLLSTNSVSLGIVWSIWQKCGGPQSETDNVISNWMSQSLVSFQGDCDGQNCSVRAAGEGTCVALLSTSAWPFISGRKHWSHRAIISSDSSYSGSSETFWKILVSRKCRAKSWQSHPRESCTINIKIEFRQLCPTVWHGKEVSTQPHSLQRLSNLCCLVGCLTSCVMYILLLVIFTVGGGRWCLSLPTFNNPLQNSVGVSFLVGQKPVSHSAIS